MRKIFKRRKGVGLDRTRVVDGALALIFFVFILYLFDLQVLRHEAFFARAQRVYLGRETLLPSRGDIFVTGRNGELAAAARSERLFTVYWDARRGHLEDLDRLSQIVLLSKSKEAIALAAKGGQSYFLVAKEVPLDKAKQILKEKIAVDLEEEIRRTYPFKGFLSRTIGFTLKEGQKEVGQYGLEARYDELLSGFSGFRSNEVVLKNPRDGASLITAVDLNIQREAERIIRQGVETYKAESGLAVVMDVKTGELLAVADEPGFDLNQYFKVTDYGQFKSSLIEAYEPGSVFKAITFAAGLENEAFKPTDTYKDVGSIFVDGYTIENYDRKKHGLITLQEALDHSLNLGAIRVLELLGQETFAKAVEAFGFGKITGVDLPFEKPGSIANLFTAPRHKVNFYTASFGQGISVTPLQLLTAFSAFANKGVMMRPHVVKEIRYADGSAEVIYPQTLGKPISGQTAEQMTNMLERVVTHGSGRYAQIKGFRVAGKTGSAQVPAKGGYSKDEVINTFVGYLPASKPEVIILVKLTKPSYEGPRWSEVTAVPLWNSIARFVVQYFYLEPDNL